MDEAGVPHAAPQPAQSAALAKSSLGCPVCSTGPKRSSSQRGSPRVGKDGEAESAIPADVPAGCRDAVTRAVVPSQSMNASAPLRITIVQGAFLPVPPLL